MRATYLAAAFLALTACNFETRTETTFARIAECPGDDDAVVCSDICAGVSPDIGDCAEPSCDCGPLCRNDGECGTDQVCNAGDVCLRGPGCAEGDPCAAECYGYCIADPNECIPLEEQCTVVCAGRELAPMPADCPVAACECPPTPPLTCTTSDECGPSGECATVCPVCIQSPCPLGPCQRVCVPATCRDNSDCPGRQRCDKRCTETTCPVGLSCEPSCTGECVGPARSCAQVRCAEGTHCEVLCPACVPDAPCPPGPCRIACTPDPAPTPADCPAPVQYCADVAAGVAVAPIPVGCRIPGCPPPPTP